MQRRVIALVAGIAVLMATGVGFAAFTSSVYVNATASAGSVNLEFVSATTSSSPPVSAGSAATCSESMVSPSPYGDEYESSSLNFAVSNMAPGNTCGYQYIVAYIMNFGTLPATISETPSNCLVNGVPSTIGSVPNDGTGEQAYTCGAFYITDTIYAGFFPGTLAPGGSAYYIVFITFPSGTGNSAQGQSVGLTLTITGTAGT